KLPERWRKYWTYPYYPGYENVGTVVKVGKDVKDVKVGDRVLHYGPHAEYCVAPRDDVLPGYVKIPDSVSDEDAILALLGTTALWAIHRSELEYGDKVIVLGDGALGILVALHAKNAGADKVILVGNHAGKLKIAKQVGVDVVVNHKEKDWQEQAMAETDGLGADIVFECVGSSIEPTGAVREASEVARQRGKVVIVGDHMAGQPDLILCSDPYFKELTFIMSRATGPGSHHPALMEHLNAVQKYNYVKWTTQGLLERVLSMIASGKLNVHPLITHRFKYTEVAEVFKRLNEKKEDFIKVILTW
ncbi:MAG: zinc-binding alcohol dehydrogenase, partial [Candidatus Bathyarchaeia archaeon]